MKRYYLFLLLLPLLGGSCSKEHIAKQMGGMTIWWKHQVHERADRGLVFYLTGYNYVNSRSKLVFDYSIEGSNLVIELVDIVQQQNGSGSIADPEQSRQPKGELFIPDHLLAEGIYHVRLITPHFEEQLELRKDFEKYTLQTPVSNNIHCDVTEVHYMPYNVLHLQMRYEGNPYPIEQQNVLDELEQAGFIPIRIQNYSELSLNVSKDGSPLGLQTNSGRHSREFYLHLNNDFAQAEAIIKNHLAQTNIPSYRVFLFGSNGEQARLFN